MFNRKLKKRLAQLEAERLEKQRKEKMGHKHHDAVRAALSVTMYPFSSN